jgi:hypothetical protein
MTLRLHQDARTRQRFRGDRRHQSAVMPDPEYDPPFGRPPLRRRLRSGVAGGGFRPAGRRFSLPHLQRRRRRGGAVRQRRPLLRPFRARPGLDRQGRPASGDRRRPVALAIQPDGRVAVDMGQPRLEPAEIPFFATERAPRYPIAADGMDLEIGVVSMGNPHAVLRGGRCGSRAGGASWGRCWNGTAVFPTRQHVGSCRSSPRIISGFGSSSAVSAKPWPAAAAPARRWSPAGCGVCCGRMCGWSCPAAN